MLKRTTSLLVCLSFLLSNFQYAFAQDFGVNQLPIPGTMVEISVPFSPLTLKGLVVNPKKPLEFQFLVDTGHGPQDKVSIKDQTNQLIKYFLAGLTVPEGELWVNLSPYEKERMLPEVLGQTDLGRDLLAQDYILKQLTASLIYPEKDLGKEFWNKVYAKAQEKFGTTNISVNTFNKVWILPNEAQVFENGNAAYVTKSTLKVMLDEDYLALQKHVSLHNGTDSIGSNIVRQIILPEIEKEVNTGKNFAPLRQIYQAMILAKWYKETIQNGLLDAVYTNRKKVAGINLYDPSIKEKIYDRYLKAYKKGAFNYIKQDLRSDGQVMPRKYFSGGIDRIQPAHIARDGAMSAVTSDGAMVVVVVDLMKVLHNFVNIGPIGVEIGVGVGAALMLGPSLIRAGRGAYNRFKNNGLKFQDSEFSQDYTPQDLIDELEAKGINVPYLKITQVMSEGQYTKLKNDPYPYWSLKNWPDSIKSLIVEADRKDQKEKKGVFKLNPEDRRRLFDVLIQANFTGIPILRVNNLVTEVRDLSRGLKRYPEEAQIFIDRLRDGQELDPYQAIWLTRVLIEANTRAPRKLLSRHSEDLVPEPEPGADTASKFSSRAVVQKESTVFSDAPVLRDGMTHLMQASYEGNLNDVKHQLLIGANINEVDHDGWTALMHAASNGKRDVVDLLLNNGADINVKTPRGASALTIARRYAQVSGLGENIALIQRLRDDVNLKDGHGNTILIRSLQSGNTDYVFGLLRMKVETVRGVMVNRVDINLADNDGKTPLMYALQNGYGAIAEEMLSVNGAFVNARNNRGQTALSIESIRGDLANIRILMKHNPDVNISDNYKVTPLMQASLNGYQDIVNLLLLKNAEVNLRSRNDLHIYRSNNYQYLGGSVKLAASDTYVERIPNGATALFLARLRTHDNIVSVLVGHGATDFAMLESSKNSVDRATLVQARDLGGIDLNQIAVHRTGKVINIQFDPAQLDELLQGGFEGFRPEIKSITSIQSPLPSLGVSLTKVPSAQPKIL